MHFLLLFASLTAHAAAPPTLCEYGACTPRMREIAHAFTAAEPVRLEQAPLLASGECFHLSPDYNPNVAHHGVVLLDQRNGFGQMGALFSFFAPENPYREITAELLRARLPNMYDENHRVEFTPGFAFVDMNPGGTPWLYWLKRDARRVYLVGLWGGYDRFFCELGEQ